MSEVSPTHQVRRGRRLGIDWGDARIGIAVSDPDGLFAVPLDNVAAGDGELGRIADLVAEYEPLELIVGLPRSLNGTEGPAAAKVRDKAAGLVAALTVRFGQPGDGAVGGSDTPVIRLVDERLSTVAASRRLQASGKSAKAQRRLIDSEAAREILDRALQAERASGTPPGQLLSGSDSGRGSDTGS